MISSRPLNWSLETWPVAQLVTLIRHSLDSGKVDDLVDSLRTGHELPPIIVLVDGQKATILDGHHRVAAWQKAGLQEAPVFVARPK